MALGNTVCRWALAAAMLAATQPLAAQTADQTAAQTTPGSLTTPDQGAPAGPTSEVAPDPAAGGDIIVTANKRAENIQKVPLAVSVVSPAQLASAGVRNFTDIGKIAPSLVVRPAEQPQNSNISLRGVGTFAFGIGVESSVAVLVDEVPLAFQARAFTDLPDVERIEVLRGPQSTLYGKSASAGLVNIITRDPTDELRVRANALITTDEERGLNLSVSGPASDTVGYVLSAAYNYWDGNVKNLFNGKDVNGRESLNLRGKVRWEPTDNASLTIAGNYINGNSDVGRPFIRFGANARLRGIASQTPAVVLPGVSVGPENQDVSNNYDSRTKYQGGGGYIRGEIGLGSMNLVTITSYDKFHLYDYLDHDDTAATVPQGSNVQIGQFKSEQITNEVRLQSPSDGPFRYTIGGYVAGVKFERPFYRGPSFSLASWDATAKSRQVAGFVQADWTIIPSLTLTGGGRLQNEHVSYTYRDNLAGTRFSGSASDTAFTYRGSLRYDFTPTVNAFFTYATGYKGQTYDLTTGFNRNRALAGPIRPEKSRDKELGIRSQFFDRRLTMNVTLFDTNYRDLQAQTIETLADGTSNFRLTNVGRLNTKGVEVESSLRLGSDLNLNGAVTYLDAKYTDFAAAQCYPLQTAALGCTGSPTRQNLTGTRVVQAPEWKFNVGADYSPSLGGNLRGVAQLNWQYQSSLFFQARDPETFQPAYHIVNIGLGVRDEERRWELVAFVNNLFDKQYYGSLVNSAGNFGNNIATQAVLPRDFRRYGGLRLGVNF
ncbi:iron complex outermembrane receptor protein [Sphingomonas jinjuensis]|uniref:Iron complex outermembrane receptor protein n=1 Tax=Sphingomonas jinjuensis TaxID=535907 RepID=A0A840F9T7_9SPHN|nr:TonB-dependent receptor [Sphingomonas jinjuensis]MBB4153371.1 iron complex outermembrane receptor protein [Sphingomonas jinjuensis]